MDSADANGLNSIGPVVQNLEEERAALVEIELTSYPSMVTYPNEAQVS